MKTKATLSLIVLSLVSFSLMAGEKKADYYSSKVISGSMDEVQQKTADALKTVGFGIVSSMDMEQKINEKMGSNLKPYRVLGVCNPKYALAAIEKEPNIGLFLPCKIILKDKGEGKVEVVLGNPDFVMRSLGNKELEEIGKKVTRDLLKAFNNIE